MTPDQTQALDVARELTEAGIPVFVAPADASATTGFALPSGWQSTEPDPAVVEKWQPGMALAMVCGRGLDLIDVDPRNGGELGSLKGITPVSYGAATTPSGGVHSFVKSLGVRSKNNALPGIDVKAGAADGTGRGFAFIAPTVRKSKTTGELVAYRWVNPPDLARLSQAAEDVSGRALAELVSGARHSAAEGDVQAFMKTSPWVELTNGTVFRDGRNNGVARLAQALRGQGGWHLEDAVEYMRAVVWPKIEQDQGGHEFTLEEFENAITAQWRQYPDGGEQRAVIAATPPDPQAPQANPGRHFGKGGLQAATLASDVIALGPLAQGLDNIMWRYEGGVWRPARHVVRDRCAVLLGEQFRVNHAGTAEAIVASRVQTITCEPVERFVNFRNGLLDWRTGELHPHTPDVPTTVQLPVDYQPDAVASEFDRFVREVVPEDMVETVYELVGYLMYSGNPLHRAVMLVGTGRNGKGTLLRAITGTLGTENVTSVSLHDLTNVRFSTSSLFGKLANIAGDIEGRYLENTAMFKAITGGDTISAEHKGRDRFNFTPWAVPVFSANTIPASADTTSGYLNRWLVIPFPHSFVGREDPWLSDRLSTEGERAGIAAAGVRGLRRLMERGRFPETTSGRDTHAEFARAVDQVRTWLADCTETDSDGWAPRTELYDAYKRWAERDGYKPVRAQEFYRRLESAELSPATIKGTRGFRGARLVDPGWARGTAFPTTGVQRGAGKTNSSLSMENGVQVGVQPAPSTLHPAPAGVADPVDNSSHSPAPLKPAPQPAPLIENAMTSTNAVFENSGVQEGAGSSLNVKISEVEGVGEGVVGIFGGTPHEPAPPAPSGHKGGSESARAKREAARLEAVGAAGGERVELPAHVTNARLKHVTPDEAVTAVTGALERADALTVDVETTGYQVGHANYALRTVQLGDSQAAVVFDATDADQAALVRELIAKAPRLHAHSATADLVPLVAAGLCDESAWERMYDTVIPAKLADPQSTGSDPALKKLAGAVLGDEAVSPSADEKRAALFKAGRWLTETELSTPVERSGWAQVDPHCATMVRYAASDVLDTANLAIRLPQPSDGVLSRERAVQQATARATHRGVRIDGEHTASLRTTHTAARDLAAGKVRAFGIDNPGSNKQIGDKLTSLGINLPLTDTGKPSVAAGVLDRMRGLGGQAGRLVEAVLEYRHHDTVLGTFLEPYRQLVEYGDGRARPTIYTLGTDTGRMSCVRPNLQQLPREGGVRACIAADPGLMLVSADFSGVELRVAAALSGDTNLIRMLAEGVDIHWEIAREVFGPDATKSNRYVVKRGVFGYIYGGGVPTLARQVGVSESVMASAVDVLKAMSPELANWSRDIREAVKAGQTQYPTRSGRIIHLPQAYPHKGPNYCIQGTARELLVDAILKWEQTQWGGAVILPVHDEILTMVPADEAEAATKTLVSAMEDELYGVHIVAEASEPSFAWQDAV